MIAAYQARCQARVDAALDALFVAPAKNCNASTRPCAA